MLAKAGQTFFEEFFLLQNLKFFYIKMIYFLFHGLAQGTSSASMICNNISLWNYKLRV